MWKLLSNRTKKHGRRKCSGKNIYIDVPTDQLTTESHGVDDVTNSADESECLSTKMSLPPRYRFRDLLLGDFAFTDDGQRWGCFYSPIKMILYALILTSCHGHSLPYYVPFITYANTAIMIPEQSYELFY